MSPLQLALLVVGLAAALAIYWVSRRKSNDLKDWNAGGDVGDGLRLGGKGGQQLDMFSGAQFDEFGVGKPRPVRPGEGPTLDGLPNPAPPQAAVPPKGIVLLLAEREGTHILGMKIHMALKGHGLQFGAGEIYHRIADGEPVFSVAGLLKPGTLNPADAVRFSTPGLSVFMTLPGPLPAMTAFREFVATAQSLARSLNAEVLDGKKRPLTPTVLAQLEADVEDWIRENPSAA